MNATKSASASLRVLGPVRSATPAELDCVALPLLPAIADIGELRQWALADERKIAVRFDGRRPWGGASKGDQCDVIGALEAGRAVPSTVLGTFDEARRALVRLHGRPVPVRDPETGAMVGGPVIDGLSIRFLPVPGRRLVGVDFDGVIDERRRLHRACRWLLDELGTFVEVSVSGRGLHAYVWCDVDDDAPDCAVAHGLGDGYGRFVPWPSKVPSVAIYCGRTWRHFRWSGVGYGKWGGFPIADATTTINRWLRDIAACRAVDAWRRSLERPVEVPRARAGIGSRISWQTVLRADAVAAVLGGRLVGGRLEAQCPWCALRGRRSASGRPSLVIWDGVDGRVGIVCWSCREAGMSADVWRTVGDCVARAYGVAS